MRKLNWFLVVMVALVFTTQASAGAPVVPGKHHFPKHPFCPKGPNIDGGINLPGPRALDTVTATQE